MTHDELKQKLARLRDELAYMKSVVHSAWMAACMNETWRANPSPRLARMAEDVEGPVRDLRRVIDDAHGKALQHED